MKRPENWRGLVAEKLIVQDDTLEQAGGSAARGQAETVEPQTGEIPGHAAVLTAAVDGRTREARVVESSAEEAD